MYTRKLVNAVRDHRINTRNEHDGDSLKYLYRRKGQRRTVNVNALVEDVRAIRCARYGIAFLNFISRIYTLCVRPHEQFLDSSFIATVKCAEESWPLRGYNGIAVVISSNYKNIVYTHTHTHRVSLEKTYTIRMRAHKCEYASLVRVRFVCI